MATGAQQDELIRQIDKRFRQLCLKSHISKSLQQAMQTPLGYEDNIKQDAAMEFLPLERLYSTAEENESKDDTWGMQDYLIMELLKWFKHDFFKWVNTLNCTKCGKSTKNTGGVAPSPTEANHGAGVVEIHKCECGNTERFPRYNDPLKLCETKQGRCGEWANCFTFLCRCLGVRARYIWNKEDHVWTEVYSEKQQRWVHCDCCEEAWDKPTLYEQGWGKKMSICVALSVDGVKDVSRRYIRDKHKALPRDRIENMDLIITTLLLTGERRKVLNNEGRERLLEEDKKEEEELRSYVVDSTQKVGPRQTGSAEWTASRGEDG